MLNASVCRLLFVVAAIAAAGVALWQAQFIPAPRFEPVGGARVPQLVAMVILALGALRLLSAVWRRGSTEPEEGQDRIDRRGFAVAGIMAAAVLALENGLAGFAVVAGAFLISLQFLYPESGRRWLVRAAILIVVAIALEYAFTRIFVVDLPRSF